MIQQVGWEVRGTFKGAKDLIISICFGMVCAWSDGGVSFVQRKGRSAHRIGLKREGSARLGKAGQTTDKTGLFDFLAPSSHLHTLTHPFFSLYSEQHTGLVRTKLYSA